ncbi:MAG: hypothetical protein WC850_06025 [Candidatus Gracilibacteria bacterium]
MKIDINNMVNDLGHAALNGFNFSENIRKSDKEPQYDVYINEINENVQLEVIVETLWGRGMLLENNPKTVIKLHIVIGEQKLGYAKELRIKYEDFHSKNLTKIPEFKTFFETFKENIRLFNGDVLKINPKGENEKI